VIKLPVGYGQFALIDDRDRALARFKWTIDRRDDGLTYAVRRVRQPDGSRRKVYLHDAVLGLRGIDHRDRNGLDCRRKNLRAAGQAQNGANRGLQRNNRTGFKGVYWFRRDHCWTAQVQTRGRRRHLGYFSTPEEAARAYDDAAREHFGEFARLNFPQRGERSAR
jgi:hypothetical protein